MKKLNTLVLASFLTLSVSYLQAQTFNFSPSEYIIDDIELGQYKNFQVDMEHPQTDDLTLVWVLVENSFLQKWDYTSCDNGGCYSAIPDTGVISALPDTIPGYIRITLNANDQTGTGTVTLYVYNITYPDQGQYVTFEITAMAVTAVTEVTTETFRVFPNPASDFIQVHNAAGESAKFQLIDLTGKTTFEEKLGAGTTKRFDITNLPSGIYFANYKNSEGFKTKKIIIQ